MSISTFQMVNEIDFLSRSYQRNKEEMAHLSRVCVKIQNTPVNQFAFQIIEYAKLAFCLEDDFFDTFFVQ